MCLFLWRNHTVFWLLLLLCNTVWNQDVWWLQLCSSFSKLLWLFEVFYSLFHVWEKYLWNFDRDCIESVYWFEFYGCFNIINSFNPYLNTYWCLLQFLSSILVFSIQIFHPWLNIFLSTLFLFLLCVHIYFTFISSSFET